MTLSRGDPWSAGAWRRGRRVSVDATGARIPGDWSKRPTPGSGQIQNKRRARARVPNRRQESGAVPADTGRQHCRPSARRVDARNQPGCVRPIGRRALTANRGCPSLVAVAGGAGVPGGVHRGVRLPLVTMARPGSPGRSDRSVDRDKQRTDACCRPASRGEPLG
jgi:hypothetical protein